METITPTPSAPSTTKTTALRRWATPLTIGAFVLMAVTGILMFFEVRLGIIKVAHEWSSWLMVIAVSLHVVLHWKSFSRYFSQTLPAAVIGLFAVLTVAAMLIPNNAPQRGGPPGGFGGTAGAQATQLLLSAPLATIATLSQQTPDAVVAKLEAQGLTSVTLDQSLSAVATNNQRNPVEMLNVILKK